MTFLLFAIPPRAATSAPQRPAALGAAIAMLAGREGGLRRCRRETRGPADPQHRARREHEGVAAYRLARKRLLKARADLAVKFQGHHKQHIDALAKTVEELSGKAAGPKAKYEFPVAQLERKPNVLGFAAKLEQVAVSAYLGAVPLFANRRSGEGRREHPRVMKRCTGRSCARRWAGPVPSAFVS